MLRDLLSHPLTKGMDLDAPLTTELRLQILQNKPFLRKVYAVWYRRLAESVAGLSGPILELGSGAGFLDQVLPDLITSEILFCKHIKAILNGLHLPFADGALSAIVMTDVFHHLPEPRRFFQEAARCIEPGGVISMIEPWNSRWSAFVYKRLHHEPFIPSAVEWTFPNSGPLSSANQALPWIIFERDREQFFEQFPYWKMEEVKPMMPFSYLLSGGISLRNLMPAWSFAFWTALEVIPWLDPSKWAMFAHIILRRTEA